MPPFELELASCLEAPPGEAWRWATSVAGIRRELWPLAVLTFPRGAERLADLHVEPGRPLARSWLLLFGVLPVDRSDLTLVELDVEGRRFLEQSPMWSMRLWRHERRVEPFRSGSRLTDRLTFEPRFAAPLVRALVRTLFRHRHRVLRRELGALPE